MKVLRKSYDIAHGIKVQKGVWNSGHREGIANGEHEEHEDKNTREIGW